MKTVVILEYIIRLSLHVFFSFRSATHIDLSNNGKSYTYTYSITHALPISIQQFVEAAVESSMKLVPSAATALPISDTASVIH